MYLCVRSIHLASFYDSQFDCGIVLTVGYFFNSGLLFKTVSSEEVNTIVLTVWYFFNSGLLFKTVSSEEVNTIVLTVWYFLNSGLSFKTIIGGSLHNDCSRTNKKKGDNSHLKVSLLVVLLSIISNAKCIVLVCLLCRFGRILSFLHSWLITAD